MRGHLSMIEIELCNCTKGLNPFQSFLELCSKYRSKFSKLSQILVNANPSTATSVKNGTTH